MSLWYLPAALAALLPRWLSNFNPKHISHGFPARSYDKMSYPKMNSALGYSDLNRRANVVKALLSHALYSQAFQCRSGYIFSKLGQCQACWSPGPTSHQIIKRHDDVDCKIGDSLSLLRWLNAKEPYLQGISNGVTSLLHQAIDLKVKIT